MNDKCINHKNMFCVVERAHTRAHQHLGEIHIYEWIISLSRIVKRNRLDSISISVLVNERCRALSMSGGSRRCNKGVDFKKSVGRGWGIDKEIF